jgi:hypothetical protein
MKRTVFVIAALGLFLFCQAAQADWTPAKRITWTTYASYYGKIAADSFGTLHVVFYNFGDDGDRIFYKKSTDGGTTWTPSRSLVWAGELDIPDIAVDSYDDIHVAWSDDTPPGGSFLSYRKSTDGGATWTPTSHFTWGTYAKYPEIIADSSTNLYVTYEDGVTGDWVPYYKKSTNSGATWSTRRAWAFGRSLAVDPSGNLHAVWGDSSPGNQEIFYKKSTNGGATWTARQRLTWTAGDSKGPEISIDPSGQLHVLWCDNTPGQYEYYYKKSTDGGNTWTPGKRVTWGLSAYGGLTVAADPAHKLHAVWVSGASGNHELYYTNSSAAPIKRLTWNSGSSDSPDLIADPSGNLHVVWYDDTPGHSEIYYKKYVK